MTASNAASSLRDLDILMAVIETGSMGKAASRLNISQPAVSKAIVELEDALGVQLVDRGRRGVAPTPYGLALRQPQRLDFQRSSPGRAGHRLSFRPDQGRNPHRDDRADLPAIVSPVIDGCRGSYPRMFFHVVAGDTATLYTDVAERNIELAICRMIGKLPDELAAEILFHYFVAVMTAAANPLARRRNLKLADLANEPWVLFPYESFFGRSLPISSGRTDTSHRG